MSPPEFIPDSVGNTVYRLYFLCLVKTKIKNLGLDGCPGRIRSCDLKSWPLPYALLIVMSSHAFTGIFFGSKLVPITTVQEGQTGTDVLLLDL